jgi:hypothetical protein
MDVTPEMDVQYKRNMQVVGKWVIDDPDCKVLNLWKCADSLSGAVLIRDNFGA